ncbi:MAG: hypothetical protein SFZ03_10035 [Candidatus Melainabacteria bacterium]|nr:hypothetical protein [Candidatus Melainabacteria bacterium]
MMKLSISQPLAQANVQVANAPKTTAKFGAYLPLSQPVGMDTFVRTAAAPPVPSPGFLSWAPPIQNVRFGEQKFLEAPLPVISYQSLLDGDPEAVEGFMKSLTQRGAAIFTDMPTELTEHLKPLQDSFLEASQQEIPKGFKGIARRAWDGFHNKVMLSVMPELYGQFDPSDPKFEVRDSESYFLMSHSREFPNQGMSEHGPAYQKAAIEWGRSLVDVFAQQAKKEGLAHADHLLDLIQSSNSTEPHAFHTTRLLHYPKDETHRFTELEAALAQLKSQFPKFSIPKPVYERLGAHYDEDIFTLLPPETTSGLEILDPLTHKWVAPNPTGTENYWVAIAGTPLHLMTKGTPLEVPPSKHRVIAHPEDLAKDRISFATKIQVHPKESFAHLSTGEAVPNQPPDTIAYYHKIWTDRNEKQFKGAVTIPSLEELRARFDKLEQSAR